MDRLTPCCRRRVHDVLSSALSETNRGRTDHADGSETGEGSARSASGRALSQIYDRAFKIRQVDWILRYDRGPDWLCFRQKTGLGWLRRKTTEQEGTLQGLVRS